MLKRVVFSLIISFMFINLVEAKDVGKSRAAFLKVGVGARAVAMGEAFCALSDDISAIYWNPAGLAQLTQTEVMTTHHSYFQGINNEYFAFVHPNKNSTALGVSLSMLGIDGMKGYNKYNVRGSDFKANDMAMSFACSKMFGQGAAIGAGVKLVKQGLDNKDTTNLVVDLGGLSHTPIHNLVVGAAMQNIGINNNSNKKRGAAIDDDPMPFRMRLGASYQNSKSVVCVDVNMPNDGQRTTNLGIEYTLPKIVRFDTMLRAGYRIGADTGKLGFGFGILSNNCSFDYAFASYNDLGNSHRLSTSLRFGKQEPKHRVMLIEPENKKKAEPLISWLNVQRFVLGLFIEERSFPEHLQKKKDDKKKMPVLPGVNTPAETAKGTATAVGAEAPEQRKNVDFDKAAEQIDFDADEETTEAVPAAATDTVQPATSVPDSFSKNAEKPQGTTTAASLPPAKAIEPAAPVPAPANVNVKKPQGTTTSADVKQGVDNGNSLRNATSTRFRFMDIAPIDEGELLN
ncbi:MAG: PorV/PorQ family protein [bacterium]|nr:PorV/PorQ family protein [bacterium]